MPDLPRQSPSRDHRDLRRAVPAAGGRCTRICCGGVRRAGRRDDRIGDRSREWGRASVAARSGRTSVHPARVVHRGGRALPHRRGHREVLRADLPDLADDVEMDARRRTGADRTRPPGREAPSSSSRRSTTRHCRKCWLSERRRGRTRWTPTPSTGNREPSIARKAIGWWQRQGWIEGDPTIDIERRPAPPDRTKALASTGSPAPPSSSPGSSPAARPARCFSPTARHRPEHRRSTCARRPAVPGSPTTALRRSSRRTPGCWPTSSPHPTTSRIWTAGPCTGYGTVS